MVETWSLIRLFCEIEPTLSTKTSFVLQEDKTYPRATLGSTGIYSQGVCKRSVMMVPKLVRILFVEDDLDIQVIAQMALEELGGFTVMVCSSGKEALEKASLFKPDMILLDVMMPGIDGPDTLKRLRELPQTVDTPAVFMTAKVQTHEVEQYRHMGAVDVIAKPFDPMILSSTINTIWKLEQDRQNLRTRDQRDAQ
jgi:two-component system, OmpR family, response regulator